MEGNERFLWQPKEFWAHVRTSSQEIGYTQRGTKQVKVPTFDQVVAAYRKLGLRTDELGRSATDLTALGTDLFAYFQHRADVLNDEVQYSLMDAEEAQELFETLHRELRPSCPIPMNKQKGDKKAPAYLTGIVNMIVEASINGLECDYDPRELTTVTLDGRPLRTMARRVDGAFPSAVNPVAIWEIKEYYYTTTFGSRVADGVYETLLDGMELEELHEHEGIEVLHYLMVDSHYTWWECGRSYLCRMVDMVHMGYVDEVLFGREVAERLPALAADWVVRLQEA
ncbi:MAG: hypothetical protein GY788_24775 [bacterium]|nr:hypothetical protein [bacterium]